MTDKPSYRFQCRIVDESTGDVVILDHVSLTRIDQFGGCESVDHAVARMLRQFEQTAREQYERELTPAEGA